ncbi:MAG: hypothetical protein FWE48_05210 [Coriobacteriia bacterium]|nr:hypothetical protein [Coriobacteriia bacterium]MCL2870741.1 hypothetical protein [Coriobacteriia bacterium]
MKNKYTAAIFQAIKNNRKKGFDDWCNQKSMHKDAMTLLKIHKGTEEEALLLKAWQELTQENLVIRDIEQPSFFRLSKESERILEQIS